IWGADCASSPLVANDNTSSESSREGMKPPVFERNLYRAFVACIRRPTIRRLVYSPGMFFVKTRQPRSPGGGHADFDPTVGTTRATGLCTGSNGEFVYARNAEALWKRDCEEAQGLRAYRVNFVPVSLPVLLVTSASHIARTAWTSGSCVDGVIDAA